MWKSVEGVDEILCVVKEEHPEMYMPLMRDQHEALYGPHYDKHFAEMDVDKIQIHLMPCRRKAKPDDVT